MQHPMMPPYMRYLPFSHPEDFRRIETTFQHSMMSSPYMPYPPLSNLGDLSRETTPASTVTTTAEFEQNVGSTSRTTDQSCHAIGGITFLKNYFNDANIKLMLIHPYLCI